MTNDLELTPELVVVAGGAAGAVDQKNEIKKAIIVCSYHLEG